MGITARRSRRLAASLVALGTVAVLSLSGALVAEAQQPPQGGIARIEGRVLGPGNQPIERVRVQLLNDGYSPVGRAIYTDGSGRFRFVVQGGQYYVDIEPAELPYERKQERIDLNPSPYSRTGEVFFVDVVLTPRARKASDTELQGVRFYQNVPQKARSEYERGKLLLKDKPDDAYAAFRSALQIFPDYYEALETLGGEYVKAGYFDYALPILLHAIEVNPDGEGSYYALGVLFFQQGHYKNAAKAFRRVVQSNPRSQNGSIYLGLALLRDNKRDDAEVALKRAVELGATNVADLRLALAQIYIETKRYDEAIAELELLLKENPTMKERQKIVDLVESLRTKKPS